MSAGVAGRKVYWWVASWAFASAMGSCIFAIVEFFLSRSHYWFVCVSCSMIMSLRLCCAMVVILFSPIMRYRYRKAWEGLVPDGNHPCFPSCSGSYHPDFDVAYLYF